MQEAFNPGLDNLTYHDLLVASALQGVARMPTSDPTLSPGDVALALVRSAGMVADLALAERHRRQQEQQAGRADLQAEIQNLRHYEELTGQLSRVLPGSVPLPEVYLAIQGWSPEQRETAHDWAVAEQLRQADPEEPPLPRPGFFPTGW